MFVGERDIRSTVNGGLHSSQNNTRGSPGHITNRRPPTLFYLVSTVYTLQARSEAIGIHSLSNRCQDMINDQNLGYATTTITTARLQSARGPLTGIIDDIIDQRLSTETDSRLARNTQQPLPASTSEQQADIYALSEVREWIISQTTEARRFFCNQEYTSAIRVVQNAQQHPYITTLPSLREQRSLSVRAISYCLQDLQLIEYCSRVISSQDSALASGGTSIVDFLEKLNCSVLSSVNNVKTGLKKQFKTSFQLNQDPLIDKTLNVLSSAWKNLESDVGPHSPSRFGPQAEYSPIHSAFATATLPFIESLLYRNLFPCSGTESRELVLDCLLLARDHQRAMQWIWVWDRRDRADWLAQWNGSDIKQNLTAVFMHSNRPDLMLDLFRLTYIAAGEPRQWIRHLLVTLDSLQQHQDVNSVSLAHILYLADLDHGAFSAKLHYNLNDSRKQADIQCLWLESLQDPSLSIRAGENSVERHLWRDMATVGVLARDMAPDDIFTVIGPDMSATIRTAYLSMDVSRFKEQAPDEKYGDDLTWYLSRIANDKVNPDNTNHYGKELAHHHVSKDAAPLLLRLAIQETMASVIARADVRREDVINSYRSLLRQVTYQTTLRKGHLGLVSHMSELLFRSKNPEYIWNRAMEAIDIDRAAHRQRHQAIQEQRLTPDGKNKEYIPRVESRLAAMPEVHDFIQKVLGPDLAKMIANASLFEIRRSRKEHLSDWYLAMASTTVHSRQMANDLYSGSAFKAGSRSYEQAVWWLLQDQEYSLAAAFHIHAHNLTPSLPDRNPGVSATVSSLHVSDVGRIATALASSTQDPRHLELAQWIVDRHVARQASTEVPSKVSQVFDIQIATVLVGAWARRAEFGRARSVVKMMWKYNIEPNMILYNTLLQALVDLTPISKNGGRAVGGGKHEGMRELGRELKIRELLKDITLIPDSDLPGLDQGWELFHQIVSKASDRVPRHFSEFDRGMKGPQRLKDMTLSPGGEHGSFVIHEMPTERPTAPVGDDPWVGPWTTSPSGFELNPRSTSHSKNVARNGCSSQFRPDAYTLAILLGVYAKRGDIEAISELLLQTKRLGLEPDLVICKIVANAFAKKGDLEAVERVVLDAKNRNMNFGQYLTNIVLDSLVEMDAPTETIVKVMERTRELAALTPEEDVSQVDLDAKHSGRQEPMSKSLYLSHRRGKSGQLPAQPSPTLTPSSLYDGPLLDDVAFTTLIKYHTRRNDLHNAQATFNTMVQQRYTPSRHVYSLLLSTCIRLQDIASGVATIRAMREYSKINPDTKAWKGLLRCAMEVELYERRQDHFAREQIGGGPGRQAFQFPAGKESTPQVHHFHLHSEDIIDAKEERRGQHVISVLNELSQVVQELDMAQSSCVSPLLDVTLGKTKEEKEMKERRQKSLPSNMSKEYLKKVLTKEWVTVPGVTQRRVGNRYRRKRLNHPEIKGHNGMLKRLLVHFLGPARIHPQDNKQTTAKYEYKKDSLLGMEKGTGKGSVLDKEDDEYEEAMERKRQERIVQAIWLVRFVEANQIYLGRKWKWMIVARRVRQLTGNHHDYIRMLLERSSRGDDKKQGGMKKSSSRRI
ncbi:hypothetical protein BG004_003431 [Podila humilis]|nr:hypothetical protein BG004_003431 [Podila humilis]